MSVVELFDQVSYKINLAVPSLSHPEPLLSIGDRSRRERAPIRHFSMRRNHTVRHKVNALADGTFPSAEALLALYEFRALALVLARVEAERLGLCLLVRDCK